jgi:uncharacterized protein YkwD
MRVFLYCALSLLVGVPVIAFAENGNSIASQAETLIFQNVATQRAKLAAGAPAFTLDPALVEIARSRAQAMASGAAPLGHQDAKGNYPAYDAIRARFAPFNGTLGENIAVGSGDSGDANELATDTIEHWMASPGHRANLLSAGFNRIGVGVAISGSNAYVVAVFTGLPR